MDGESIEILKELAQIARTRPEKLKEQKEEDKKIGYTGGLFQDNQCQRQGISALP